MQEKPPEQSPVNSLLPEHEAGLVNSPLPENKSVGIEAPSLDDQPSVADGLGALARTTDALVGQVVRASRERDPAEHVLDQMQRLTREEQGDRTIRIKCDRCGVHSPGGVNEAIASERAEDAGWFVGDKADYCPSCKDGAKLLAGDVSIDLKRASKLGGLDSILTSRIDFLFSRILDGTTASACVANAHRSGHRHMLSDLCRGFSYDPEALFERFPELGLALFQREQEIFDWIRRLFQIVKAEDASDPG